MYCHLNPVDQTFFIPENGVENVVCEMAAILFIEVSMC